MDQATLIGIGISTLVFIIALTFHEFAHALVAHWRGDDTAEHAGRLTLNPIAHIDPIGTLILPLILIFTHSPVIIGWAKPVPFNPARFKDPRRNTLEVGIAGPIANFILFALFGIALIQLFPHYGECSLLISFLQQLMITNFILGVFNLVPIPPLDGSKVLFGLLPPRFDSFLMWLEQYGSMILLGVILLNSYVPILSTIFGILFVIITTAFGVPTATCTM